MSDRPGLRFDYPPPRNPNPKFNPLIAALPVVLVLLLSSASGRSHVLGALQGDNLEQVVVAQLVAQRAAGEAPAAASQPTYTGGAQEPAQAANATSPVQIAPASTPAPSGAPRQAPSTACRAVVGEPYCLYTVEEGDSLASLAGRFDLNGGAVPGWELLYASNRPDMEGMDEILALGQTLRIPTKPGALHIVFPGESLMALAVAYDVSSEAIAAANGMSVNDTLLIGEVLLIPDPEVIPETPVLPAGESEDEKAGEFEAEGDAVERGSAEPVATETPGAAGEDESGAKAARASTEEPEAEDAPEPEPDETEEPDDPRRMSWPVVQPPVRITNYMSASHPLGIDLGLGHNPKSQIMAAADGKVIFAGGDRCCSYGLYVIVEHSNGLRTLYAHLSTLSVSKGQSVKRGQTLGMAGDTGYARGVHLHFEVYLNGKRVNPMNYLPKP